MNPPLLLLHGALGSTAQFDQLTPLLSTEKTVYTLNFPGHGGTALDAEFSIAYFSDFVLDFLNQKKLDQVQIFGYSMGGYTALHLAAQHPERVAQIITLGTKFDWTPEIAARETALLNPEKIAAKVPVFAHLLADRHTPTDWKKVVQFTARLLQALGNGEAMTSDTFAQVSCPVLIGLGSNDHLVTVEESAAMADLLPNGRLEILPEVKHPFEQVDLGILVPWLVANLMH